MSQSLGEMSAPRSAAALLGRVPASLKKIGESWRAYSYRVPYCVPYWHGATYRAISRCVATGRVVHGPEIDQLEARLRDFFWVPSIRGYSKGRVALEIALRGLGVGAGDEVILPAFCCTSVVAPVLATGALPVLADVGQELNLTPESVETALTSRTRAIIVPHLFGNPADIEAIESLARSKGIRVIDDAAQAFGATLNGRLLGTFGDAGIVSFGSGKVCFGVGGGVLISKLGGWVDKGSADLSRRTVQHEISDTASILFWRRWRRKLLPILVAGSRLRKFREKNPSSPPEPYRKEWISNLAAAVVLTLLDTVTQNLAARRQRVCAYRQLLGGNDSLALVPHREGSACVTQVVQIQPTPDSADRSDIILSRLRSAGYEVKGSYIPLHLVSQYSGFARKTPQFAERVWPHLIELPCEPDVSMDEVERIVSIVQQS
jgi:dTDP-4-amino-4,6-dideoxygalactose transaminase